MSRFKLPRWLVVIVVLLALVLMAAPAVRAAAEDGDSSSSPAATTAATQAAEQPKAEETPSPKTSEKADPAPSEDPKPSETTEAPAPKPSQTKTATKPAKPSASASPTKKASSSSSEADPTASLVGHACVKDAGKLTGEVRISLVFDNTKRTSGEDFSAKFTYGSGEVFTSEQYAEPGELKSLEGDFPAGGTFHVRILWSGSKVLLDESFDTQECVPTTEPTEEPTSTPTVTPTPTPTVEPTSTPTEPTVSPTATPTATETPTSTPTVEPTEEPTVSPTPTPTETPTVEPTVTPTVTPTEPTPTVTPTEPVLKPLPLKVETACQAVKIKNASQVTVDVIWWKAGSPWPEDMITLKPGETGTIKTKLKSVDLYGIQYEDGYQDFVKNGVNVPQDCGTTTDKSDGKTSTSDKPSNGAPSEDDGDDPGSLPAIIPTAPTPLQSNNWLGAGIAALVALFLGATGWGVLRRRS